MLKYGSSYSSDLWWYILYLGDCPLNFAQIKQKKKFENVTTEYFGYNNKMLKKKNKDKFFLSYWFPSSNNISDDIFVKTISEYRLRPLTDPEREYSDVIVNYGGDEFIANEFNIEIRGKSLRCLAHSEWLNDEVKGKPKKTLFSFSTSMFTIIRAKRGRRPSGARNLVGKKKKVNKKKKVRRRRLDDHQFFSWSNYSLSCRNFCLSLPLSTSKNFFLCFPLP